MAQQTAVEWLDKKLSTELNGQIPLHRWYQLREAVQQAKQMEKEQRKSAWIDGNNTQRCNSTKEINECFDNYYNETYKQQ